MHLAGLMTMGTADLGPGHDIPDGGIAHPGTRPVLIRHSMWKRREFNLIPAALQLAQLTRGRQLTHHLIARSPLREALIFLLAKPRAPSAVLQQDARQRMHIQLGSRLADRFIVAAPAPAVVHLLPHHVGIALNKLVDVREDVLLHGVAPIDARRKLAVHLVPRPPGLLHEPAPEGRQILVEPLERGVTLLHADLATALLAVAKLARTAIGKAPAARALHDHLEHVFTHGRPPRSRRRRDPAVRPARPCSRPA